MTTATTPPSRPEPASRPRRGPVWFGMVVTIVIAAATVSLLLRSALQAPARQHVLVIRSGPQYEGIELIVEGDALPRPTVGYVEPAGNFTVPFFLPPGDYTLRVKSQGQLLYSTRVSLSDRQVEEIDLTRKVTTLPSTQPSTRPR